MKIVSDLYFSGPHNNTFRIPHQRSEKGSILTQQEYEEEVAKAVIYVNNFYDMSFTIEVDSFPQERQLTLTPFLSLRNVKVV